MKLTLVRGCTADSLNADGIEEEDMTDDQRQEVIDRLFQWYKKHPDNLNQLMEHVIECHYDIYDSDGEPCPCCGDYVETMTCDI